MGKRFNSDEMQKVFEILQESYDVYGPRIYQGTGCFSDTDVIRYGRLDSWEELVWDQKSDYSFKEALFPISETILYFTENEMKTADGAPRQRLIFLKSCDFHALKRLDEMYLKNGAEDYYYRRMRENTVFAVMGCKESGKNCFCVSMGTNRCEEYDMYIFQDEKGCYVELRCRELEELLWDYGQNVQEKPTFVEKNEVYVEIPEELPDTIHRDSMWQEYGSRCIGCGRCNFVCPTCTCFTMQDIFYKDNPKSGERRRVWASCQVDGYSDIAGGHSFRQSQGERMRFKVLHKISDYKKRFGYHMCVGCGRCENVCPEYISYIACLQKLKEKEGK